MLPNIHFTKALVLVSILILISILTFNSIIQNERVKIFESNSKLTLPPVYEIIQNTAGEGNYRTDVILIFRFDEKNYESFLRLNNISYAADKSKKPTSWKNEGNVISRKITPDIHTTILEEIDTRQKQLKFHYQKE